MKRLSTFIILFLLVLCFGCEDKKPTYQIHVYNKKITPESNGDIIERIMPCYQPSDSLAYREGAAAFVVECQIIQRERAENKKAKAIPSILQ